MLLYFYYLSKKYGISAAASGILLMNALGIGLVVLPAGLYYQIPSYGYFFMAALVFTLTIQSTIRVVRKSDNDINDAIAKFSTKKGFRIVAQHSMIALFLDAVLFIFAYMVQAVDGRLVIVSSVVLIVFIILGVFEWWFGKIAIYKLEGMK
ncbi:hypothetical protein LJC27_06950 [Christensenellaceae bacterium OttesenSCG-928-M15]|nr:hypothetical protein [Christensenellaceae bacterium OttesenSCG-928-M15]